MWQLSATFANSQSVVHMRGVQHVPCVYALDVPRFLFGVWSSESTLVKFARAAPQRTAEPPLPRRSECALFPHIVRRPPLVMHGKGPEVVPLTFRASVSQPTH